MMRHAPSNTPPNLFNTPHLREIGFVPAKNLLAPHAANWLRSSIFRCPVPAPGVSPLTPALATMVVTPKMEAQNVDLKQTINLPKTGFSMKANLPQAKPKILDRWEKERLYHQIRASRKGRPLYVLHDGPP